MNVVDVFRSLHRGDEVLLLPNAWDAGSARILQQLGFSAVATTSSGSAAARGMLDGELDRDTVLAHGAELAHAVDVPVSADLENCFADDPAGVAETITLAAMSGLAGVSVEDWSGEAIYPRSLAADRVRAAVEAAAGRVVVTARAENHFRGVDDLDDTVARLMAFQRAGADVLFAPGIRTIEQIRAVVECVDVPVNVLLVPGMPAVPELAELGVRRVSVGGAFAFAAYASLIDAAQELRAGQGASFLQQAGRGREVARQAFG
jgi:2-methylisocitrate lyase-like PEP mutase family enzyme